MAFVDRILRPRAFPLPRFEPVPLEFEAERLDRPPVPTAGELCETIERHLGRKPASDPGADAAEELRQALVELRASLP